MDAFSTPSALFLDRDGTLNVDCGYLSDPAKIELLPGAREFIHLAQKARCMLFLFTNQSGIGRGLYTLEDAERCNERLIELLEAGPAPFRKICIAPEHPDAPSVYRKPCPRFIEECMASYHLDPSHCWMIGDRRSDWAAGINANIQAAAVSTGESWSEADHAWMAEHRVPVFADLSALAACFFSTSCEAKAS